MSFRIDQLDVLNLATVGNSITAGSFVRSGGTSSQFLKADGTVDTNAYITGITSTMVTTALGYTPVPQTRTLTINGTTFDLSANRSWTIAGGVASVSGSGAGISVSPTTGAVVVSNTGVTSNVAGTGISVSGATGAVTITNTGVTSIVAGTAITISGATGAVTINNAGVTSLNGSTGALTGFATQAWVTSQGYITSASVGNGTLTLAVSGSGLSGSASFTANQSTATTFTVTSNATNANTASTIVFRDASGNFSAGTITAALSGNATTASTWQTARTLTIGSTGKSVNGSADVSWSLSEIGAPSTTGTGASGTWGINITGDAATVGGLASNSWARLYYGDSGAFNLNVSGQQGFFRYSTGNWVNAPISGNFSHVMSVNLAGDQRTFQVYFGDVPGYLWWRPAQGNLTGFHPWERILTSNNFNGWAPTLTGGGASGTWSINITGSAGSASTASQVTINYNNDSNSTYQLLWGSGNSVYGTSQVYVNPSSDVIYARGGYISPGNAWGTADSAFFPNGITTAGSTNWVYGRTYIGNAPGNGSGVDISSVGSSYFLSGNTSGTWGYAGQFVDRNNAANNYIPWSFESEYGNHSWGIVARFHIQQTGADKPAIQFTATGSNERWSLGYCTGSDYNFRITQNQAYRTDNSGTDGWGTERFRINTDGTTLLGIQGSNTNVYGLLRLASNNNLYLDNNYGQSIIGLYSASRYQGVFAMGDAYKLPIDGTGPGNLYGLAWSHPNAGGVAGNLNTHGLLVLENGTFLAAISGSIRARDDMRAPIFYDSANTAYYCDPNSDSRLNTTTTDQDYTYGWFRNYSNNTGLYNQNTTQHWSSTANGYWDASSTTTVSGIRFYTGGHLGALRGYVYANTSNEIGFLNTSGNWSLKITNSGDAYVTSYLYVNGAGTSSSIFMQDTDEGQREIHCNSNRIGFLTQAGNWGAWLYDGADWEAASSVRAPIFYDSQDTTYYADFHSTSQSAIRVRGGALHGPNPTWGKYLLVGGDGRQGYVDNTDVASVSTTNGNLHIDAASGYGTYINWYDGSELYFGRGNSSAASAFVNSSGNWNFGNTSSASYLIHARGDIYADGGWVRVSGSSGLYFESFAGGWHMTDSSYIRSYNAKSLHMNYASVDYVGSMYLESGGQGVHLQPNTGSYGSLQVTGSRGGWYGIRFTGNNVNIMANTNEVGFHNNGAGWQFLWSAGTAYVYKGGTGGGTQATVWDSVNAPRAGNSLLMYYQGFTLDANTMDGNSSGFTYSVNAPYTGPIVRFSETGYSLQLNAAYGGGGNLIAFRTRNGDAGTWNPWREFITSGNIGSQNVNYANQAGTASFAASAGNTSSISSATGGSYTWTGQQYFQSNLGGYCGSLSGPPLQAYSTSNNSAFFSFHKSGVYAVNMGLDADSVLRIGGWSAASNRWQLDMSGNMTVAGDVTAYSDARVKENVETVEDALDKVLNLRGVYYNRTDSDDKRRKVGVIAQEILEVIPEVVGQDNDGMYNVSYGNIVGVLIEAIKEQQKQIDELKARLD